MRRLVALVAFVGGAVILWRRNPRIGTTFVNTVVNPLLLRRGLSGGRVSEIGTLEHVGRKSGIRRLTLVHPEQMAGGFRVMVPLGPHSEWAHNVLAAGGCRLQLHERVYELDEPRIVGPAALDDLPRIVRAVMAALGFEYLELRIFRERPGNLLPAETPLATNAPAATEALAEPVAPAAH